MRNKLFKIVIAFVIAAVAVLSSAVIFIPVESAEAMLPFSSFDGVNAVGIVPKDKDNTLELESVDIDINIYKEDDPKYYDEYVYPYGSAKTTYTFVNNTAEAKSVKALLPVGFTYENNTAHDEDNISFYSVKLNGEAVENKIRYTYKQRRDSHYNILQLDLDADRAFLSDEYVSTSEFGDDTLFYKYRFTPIYSETQMIFNTSKIVCKYSYAYEKLDGRCYVDFGPARRDVECVFYSQLAQDEFIMRADNGRTPELFCDGQVTLGEIADEQYDKSMEIDKTDWFNMLIAKLSSDFSFVDLNRDDQSEFRWFEFVIDVPAGERAVCEVCMPLYPAMTIHYSPFIFDYTYSLASIKSWSEPKSINLAINTDLYVKNCSLGKLKHRRGSYKISVDSCGDALTFNACESLAPITRNAMWVLIFVGIGAGALLGLCSPLIVWGIVKAVKKGKKKKRRDKFVYASDNINDSEGE